MTNEKTSKCKCPFCDKELKVTCCGTGFCHSCNIKFIPCKKCGHLFSENLKKCPKCG